MDRIESYWRLAHQLGCKRVWFTDMFFPHWSLMAEIFAGSERMERVNLYEDIGSNVGEGPKTNYCYFQDISELLSGNTPMLVRNAPDILIRSYVMC